MDPTIKSLPSLQRVRELFDYVDGKLVRRISVSSRWPKGAIIGSSPRANGYLTVFVDSKEYKVHRIIWLHVKGQEPVCQIDHINGVETDNRIENLREATAAENGRNRKQSVNQPILKGICLRASGKWSARIVVAGKRRNLGLFTNPEEAHQAYLSAAKIHFGEFARAA